MPRGLPPRSHLACLWGAITWLTRQHLWSMSLTTILHAQPQQDVMTELQPSHTHSADNNTLIAVTMRTQVCNCKVYKWVHACARSSTASKSFSTAAAHDSAQHRSPGTPESLSEMGHRCHQLLAGTSLVLSQKPSTEPQFAQCLSAKHHCRWTYTSDVCRQSIC